MHLLSRFCWIAIFFNAAAGLTVLSQQTTGSNDDSNALTIRLVDPSGLPVANASIGFTACFGDQSFSDPAWHYLSDPGTLESSPSEVLSNFDGVAVIKNGLEIAKNYKLAIVARQADRKLIQVAVQDQAIGSILTLQMVPECRITGAFTHGSGANDSGRFAFTVSTDKTLCIEHYSTRPTFEFFLPPGKYLLESEGSANGTVSQTMELLIPLGVQSMELRSISLIESERHRLIGTKAPELADAIAWKSDNAQPLADFSGNVVLLDFWGYWCGSCISKLPWMNELQAKYGDSGLRVVGVHIDSGGTIATLEAFAEYEKSVLQKVLNGRSLSFPIVLLADSPVPHHRSDRLASCTAARDYGIESYPTMILIGRSGNVAGEFHDNDRGIALLESLLADVERAPR